MIIPPMLKKGRKERREEGKEGKPWKEIHQKWLSLWPVGDFYMFSELSVMKYVFYNQELF